MRRNKNGKNNFITGASTGIGRATAKHFSSLGWNVAATMRHPENETELQTLPGVKVYPLDVTDHAAVIAARDAAIKDFSSVDVVVNNAGYSYVGYFEEMTDKGIRDMYEVNVFGLMDVTRAFLPHFRERKDGVFVNVSSVGGIASFPGVHLYNSTKFAVEGFTEGISYELNQLGIRCILIEPGTIDTDFPGRSQLHAPNEIEEYKKQEEAQAARRGGGDGNGYGTPPSVIAELIETALNDPERKMRYADPSAQPMIDMRNNVGSEEFMKNINKMFYGK